MKRKMIFNCLVVFLVCVLVISTTILYSSNQKQTQTLARNNYALWCELFTLTEITARALQSEENASNIDDLALYMSKLCSTLDSQLQPHAEFSFFSLYYYGMLNTIMNIKNKMFIENDALKHAYQILSSLNKELNNFCFSVINENGSIKNQIMLLKSGTSKHNDTSNALQIICQKYKKIIDDYSITYSHEKSITDINIRYAIKNLTFEGIIENSKLCPSFHFMVVSSKKIS